MARTFVLVHGAWHGGRRWRRVADLLEQRRHKGEISNPAPKAAQFAVSERDCAWVDSKLTPQPIGVALQPIRPTGARERVVKKTDIPRAALQAAVVRCAFSGQEGRSVMAELRGPLRP